MGCARPLSHLRGLTPWLGHPRNRCLQLLHGLQLQQESPTAPIVFTPNNTPAQPPAEKPTTTSSAWIAETILIGSGNYNSFVRRHAMTKAPEKAQSSESKGSKQEGERDREPPTIDGVPIPEFLWDAPPRYHIFGA